MNNIGLIFVAFAIIIGAFFISMKMPTIGSRAAAITVGMTSLEYHQWMTEVENLNK